MPGKRWTEIEKRKLLLGAGAFGFEWLRRRTQPSHDHPNAPLHRSLDALKAQALRIGVGGLTRGSRSIARLQADTGYSRTQLERARKALNQRWVRTGPRGRHMISEEQADDLMEWLKHDFWAPKHRLYRCMWCTSERRPHRSRGLCSPCYYEHFAECRRLGLPTSSAGQRRLISRLLSAVPLKHETEALDRADERLRNGLALDLGQLEALVVLI